MNVPHGHYIRFSEHLFENEWPDELDEAFPLSHPRHNLVRATWSMDKPVSEIRVIDGNNDEQIEAIESCFHTADYPYTEDGDRTAVYFSRFPELAEIATEMESCAVGVLFGFDSRDVASYIEREGGSVSESPE